MKCPKCGDKKLAPILYGMPAFDEEMKRKLDNKELVLGGCCVSGFEPRYHCFGCGRDVCRPPLIVTGHGREDFRDIVTSIRFFRWPPEDMDSSLVIKKMGEKSYYLEASSSEGFIHRGIRESEWERLLKKLYGKLYLHDWKKRYEDPDVPDGEEWYLEIMLRDGRMRTNRGRGAYPPYWKELLEALRPFFRRPYDPLRGSGRPAEN